MANKKQKTKSEAQNNSIEDSRISTQRVETSRDLIAEFVENKKEKIIEIKKESRVVIQENKSLLELIKALKESMDSCDINFKLRLAAEVYFNSIGESYINTSGDLVEPKKNEI